MARTYITRAEATKIVRGQQANDRIKNIECDAHEVILIRLQLNKVSYSQFQSHIENEYERLTGNRIRRPPLDFRKAARLLKSGFLRLDFFLR